MIPHIAHELSRGDIVLLMLPDGRMATLKGPEEAAIQTAMQLLNSANLGGNVQRIGIGMSPEDKGYFDSFIHLPTDPTLPSADIPIKRVRTMQLLTESRFHALKRIAAGFVIGQAIVDRVSFNGWLFPYHRTKSGAGAATTASPVGAMSFLWEYLAPKNVISYRTAQRLAFLEGIVFFGLLVSWPLSGMSPVSAAHWRLPLVLASSLVFGFLGHWRVMQWKEGEPVDAGPAGFWHRMGFTTLGLVFQIPFLWHPSNPWVDLSNPWIGLGLVLLIHAFYDWILFPRFASKESTIEAKTVAPGSRSKLLNAAPLTRPAQRRTVEISMETGDAGHSCVSPSPRGVTDRGSSCPAPEPPADSVSRALEEYFRDRIKPPDSCLLLKTPSGDRLPPAGSFLLNEKWEMDPETWKGNDSLVRDLFSDILKRRDVKNPEAEGSGVRVWIADLAHQIAFNDSTVGDAGKDSLSGLKSVVAVDIHVVQDAARGVAGARDVLAVIALAEEFLHVAPPQVVVRLGLLDPSQRRELEEFFMALTVARVLKLSPSRRQGVISYLASRVSLYDPLGEYRMSILEEAHSRKLANRTKSAEAIAQDMRSIIKGYVDKAVTHLEQIQQMKSPVRLPENAPETAPRPSAVVSNVLSSPVDQIHVRAVGDESDPSFPMDMADCGNLRRPGILRPSALDPLDPHSLGAVGRRTGHPDRSRP